jgi:hypothetical protein
MPWFANPARYEQMQYRYCGKAACACPHCRWVCGIASAMFKPLIPSVRCCVKPSI